MKELVCVAPDGSLEVWLDRGRNYLCDMHLWVIFYEEGPSYRTVISDGPEKPEFWGREVLSDL